MPGMSDFLFGQQSPRQRLAAMRWSLAGVVGLTIATLPPGEFFTEHRETMAAVSPDTARHVLGGEEYERLKAVTLASVALWAATGSPAAGLAATAAYGRLNQHVVAFFPATWSYNSHLNLYMAVVAFTDGAGHRAGRDDQAAGDRIASLAMALMQTGVGAIYLQAGFSKLRHGGWEWIRTGRTLRGSVALMGTPLARRWLRDENAARVVSAASVAFELLFLPALLSGKVDRRLLGAAGVAFHVGTWLIFRISFWQLAALYPALFWASGEAGDTRAHRVALVGRRIRQSLLPTQPYSRSPRL
jgi:hypothetical protein